MTPPQEEPGAAAVTTAPSAGASTAPELLLDDADVRIEHHARGSAGGTLVITFDPILVLAQDPPFAHDFLHRQALDVVAVRKKSEHFYQPLSRQAFVDAVAPVARRHARVVCYGSSLGAYAALYYGAGQGWTVIASSPRNSAHPVHGVARWQRKVAFRHEPFRAAPPSTAALAAAAASRLQGRVILLYDPRDARDHRYVEGELRPGFPDARVLPVPYAGHPANQFLSEIGFLAPFVRAVLADRPEPALERRPRRARSAMYLQVLAEHCLAHRHLVWADALSARSLALAPRRLLALRTRGRVLLARQAWDEAEAAFEAALRLDEGNALSRLWLDRARRRGAPADALASATPGPAGAGGLRRLWFGLRRTIGLAPAARAAPAAAPAPSPPVPPRP